MSFFDNLFRVDTKNEYLVTGLSRELNSIYVYDHFKKNNDNILLVTNSLYEANDLYNRISNYTDKVLFFPMDDFMSSEVSALSPELMIERLNTLNKVINSGKYIVICNLMGLLRYLPDKNLYKSKIVNLGVNDDVNRDELINSFFELGYDKVPLVTKTGEMAVRGYVVDIFPIGFDNPVRIEFWGDTIDSIKYFDLDSQSSNKQIDKISIYPFTEFLVDNKNSIDSKLYKQKYLSNFSDIVYGIWNYLDNFTLIYYDYNQIISSYRFLRESIINYDNEISDNIKTNYMFDISDVKYDNIIYMLEFDNLIDLDDEIINEFNSTNFDEYRLNEIQEVFFKLNRLKRKYGQSIEAIKEAKEDLEMKVAAFNNRETYLNDLKKQLDIAYQETKSIAEQITRLRQSKAKEFTELVTKELKSLYLDKVVFKVDFKLVDFQKNGQDNVEFLISTNAGQTLKPLNKVASGGEMSRIMLAIKILSLSSSSVETIIFDEADTGVSGKVAESIGAKMKYISKQHQVLCITHLAQVAAFAKNHYLIQKSSNDNYTNVKIKELSYDQSINEIAKLISGKEVSQESINHAKKLKISSE